MHPKPIQKLFVFIIQATILSIYFPSFLCETPNCNDNEPFQCGIWGISYLSYPFWGGSRPQGCGHPGFELFCQDGFPMINISSSSLSYRVKVIDFETNTLTVARQDLYNNTCPKVLRNTTINHRLFYDPSNSTDENVTLYFDCTDDDQSQLETLTNKFSCDVNKSPERTINLFKTGDASSGPGPNITCKNNIFVPVNQKAAQSLENPTTSSINILQAALESGFSIQWIEDPAQRSRPVCNSNFYRSWIPHQSKIYARACNYWTYCGRGESIAAPIPSVAPEERHDPPLVQSPRSPAKGEGYNAQTGKGMPPVQSPSYPPESRSNHRQTGNGPNPRKNPAKEIIIVVTLSITGVIIVSITLCCFLKRRHSTSAPNQECNQYVEKFLLQHGSLTPKRYKYSEIKKITKSFSDKLGQGGYGSVYKGMLPDGCHVAVKVLSETNSSGEEFINEVASISRTSHVNIVSLLGFCYEGNKRALVYEFMPNKSLDKFLSNNGSTANTDCCLDLEKLYRIAVGIAKGLEYLHTGCSTRIVHFDIKPQNILLDEDFCPKISDFGLAKLCKKKQSILSVLGTRGTIGYIAPEMFSRNFGGVSHKSDVYSYGMMVLEMAGAKNIIETEVIQSSENYFPDRIYEQVILDVTKKLDDFMIEEEEETRRKMFLVGFWCIQTTPSDRPSMSKVVEMLEGSLQSIPIPPKPFLFSPNLPKQEISSSFSAYIETENSAQD